MSDVLEELVTKFVYDVDQIGLRKYEAAQKKINKNTKEMIGLNSTLAKGIKKLFLGFGIGFGALSMAKTYEQLDLTRRSIEGLTKSTQDWAYVQNEAFRTATDIEVVAKGYRNFFAAANMAGFDKNGIQEMYSGILVSARAIGATSQQTEGALLALEQMISKGVVSMEELRRQLGNALPGAFEIGAKAMNMTTQEFNKLVKTGKLVSKEFVPKFVKTYLDEFGGGFGEAMKSANAAIIRLRISWKQFIMTVGDTGAGAEIAKGLNYIAEFLRSPEAVAIAKGIGQALSVIAKLLGLVVKNFKFILIMFGVSALSKLPALLDVIKVSVANIGKVGMIAGKNFLWLTIISTVLYGIYLLIEDIYTYIKHPEWDSFTKDLIQRFPILNKAIAYMKSVIADMKPILHDVGNYAKDFLNSFIQFERNTGLFKKGIKGLVALFLGLGVTIAWCLKMIMALIDKTNKLHDTASGGLMGGLIGAAGGFAFGGPVGAAIGGIAGTFGGAKFMPKLEERYRRNQQGGAYNLNKAEATTTNVNNNQKIAIYAQDRSDNEIVALIQKASNNDYDAILAMTNQTPTLQYASEA